MFYKTAFDVDSSNPYSDTSPLLSFSLLLQPPSSPPPPLLHPSSSSPLPTFSECLCGLGKVLMDKVFQMLDHLEPEEAEVRECNHISDSMA